MGLILCIESATRNCSVALVENETVLASRDFLGEGYSHAEKLHVFIDDVLQEASRQPDQLNAVAVTRGPGSYTGLRIGVSTAKGLCYALGIPLISYHTLEVIGDAMRKQYPGFDEYVPMLDARRMEVYTCRFNAEGEMLDTVGAIILDRDYFTALSGRKVLFGGDGAAKGSAMMQDNQEFKEFFPSASMATSIARNRFMLSDFENVAYFEPYYLKDFIPGIPRSK